MHVKTESVHECDICGVRATMPNDYPPPTWFSILVPEYPSTEPARTDYRRAMPTMPGWDREYEPYWQLCSFDCVETLVKRWRVATRGR